MERIKVGSVFSSLFVATILWGAANPWFNEKSYAAMNPDLVKVLCPKGDCDPKVLRDHYLKTGIKLGRIGRPYANPNDLKEALEAEKLSPASALKRENLDVVRDFKIDNLSVSAVVRGPADITNRPRKDFRLKAANEAVDAYFTAMCDFIRKEKVGVLNVPKQNLVVDQSSDKNYQVVLKDIQDVGINFSGSTLVLTDTTKRGLLITGNLQRVRIHGLTVDWSQSFYSPASVELNKDQSIVLKVDKATGALPIRQFFGFYDLKQKRWNAQTGRENWVDFSSPIIQSGASGIYQAKELESLRPFLKVGQPYEGIVRHHAPGKMSVMLSGDQVEDVQFTQLNIPNSAYMGLTVERIKRGFLLSESTMMPKADAYTSTASDAVHITSTQDIILEKNKFMGMGDDGLNIQSYNYKLGRESRESFEVESPHFRPMSNDKVAVYSAVMDFLGTAVIASAKVVDMATGKYLVTFQGTERLAAKLQSGFRIGILREHPSRIVVQGNDYGYNRARGIVIQGSLALIQNNNIVSPANMGIFVASDAENWSEGLGASSILFQGNVVQKANYYALNRNSRNLGAITVMSEVLSPGGVPEFVGMPPKAIATYPLFQNLHFVANTISDSKGAGVFISSSKGVNFSRNKIKATLLSPGRDAPGWGSGQGVAALAPITVFRSFDVKSDDNSNMRVEFPAATTLSPTE